MLRNKKSEGGQAIVLLALGLIVMLGFTALAIDGSMIYSDRRHAQNAVDASALAAAGKLALELENNHLYYDDFVCDNSVITTGTAMAQSDAISRAASSGYTSGLSFSTNCVVSGDEKYIDITTHLTRTTQTAFIQLVYQGATTQQVSATARIRPRHPIVPFTAGYAIVALHNCVADGGHDFSITGGGNSGGIETWEGGMFVNSPDTGGNCCAIDPPSSAPSIGIIAHDGYQISSVGTCDHDGNPKVLPHPIQTNTNGGVPVGDPLPGLVMPTCTGSAPTNVTVDSVTYDYGPGNINGISAGTYAPGVYCVHGSTHLSGQSTVTALGVVFYFVDGGLLYTGNAGMTLTAPTADDCTGDACDYIGIALLAARDNTSTIEVRGNGSNAIEGLVYAIKATIQARGGGSDPDETVVVGQIIANKVYGNGNGSFKVTYQETYDFGGGEIPTSIDLQE
jgi:Flp pilus assembly protein TadG